MARKVFLYVFAFIGLISTILLLTGFFKENQAAKRNSNHCKEVKEGMSLDNVRMLMGGPHSGDIQLSRGNGTSIEYYLHYPSASGSIGIDIYFDPRTLIVTNIICDE